MKKLRKIIRDLLDRFRPRRTKTAVLSHYARSKGYRVRNFRLVPPSPEELMGVPKYR